MSICQVWTILCGGSAIDVETNIVSLHEVIEEITVNLEPKPDTALGVAMDLVTLWMRDDPGGPARGYARLELIAPSGSSLLASEMEVDLTKHERRRTRLHIRGLPAPESGRYHFSIQFRSDEQEPWQEVNRLPLTIKYQIPV